jgi:serine/threonine-protein kinase
VDGRSDLYSLGITAYEIITGKVPFSGATPQLMLAHLQLPPPPLSSVIADQPPELDLVLARALAKSPDKRYATGAAFVTALREVARSYQIIEATTAGLAFLAQPESSSGQLTQAIDRTQTQPAPSPVRPPKPPVPHRQPSTPPPVGPSDPNIIPRKPIQSIQWRMIVPIAIGVILLAILVLFIVLGGGPRPITPRIPSPSPLVTLIVPTKQPTSTLMPTAIPLATVLPSVTPTEIPTPTARPTRRPPIAPTEVPVEIPTEFIPEPTIEIPTEIPTEFPTETIVPITDVPVATTAIPLPTTVVPLPTATSVPPTNTVVVPTNTVVVPTTAVAVATTAIPPTATSVPPTATLDLPTATSVPPTATLDLPTVTLTP